MQLETRRILTRGRSIFYKSKIKNSQVMAIHIQYKKPLTCHIEEAFEVNVTKRGTTLTESVEI